MTTIANYPDPGAGEVDPEDDDAHDYGPTAPAFPLAEPNPAMSALLTLLRPRGYITIRSGSNEWNIACPHHLTLGGCFNPHTVRLEQRPTETVWVHPPAGYKTCSCTPEQIIAGFDIDDWRIVPAGTTPERPKPAESISVEPYELGNRILAILRARGRPINEHPDTPNGFISTCPVKGCGAPLDLHVEDEAPAPPWLSTRCENWHEGAEVHNALGILSPDVLEADYGASNWTFDLADDEDGEPDWAIESIIERGQFGSIYGPREVGKSLLALDYVCQIAAASKGKKVLYLDHENPRGEIHKRIRAMGYKAGDLASLVYAHFPPIRALDTETGAAAFTKLVDKLNPAIVILDTWSKFIEGDEASPTTHTRAYNLAIVPVRREGVTVLAIDHAGKDIHRGPRGGSSKGDNVDVEWLITAKTGGRLRLERKKSRTGRGPDLVELTRRAGPLRHERVDLAPADVLSPEVRACVAKLDELDVPAGWGRDRAAEVLRGNEYRVRNQVLTDALKVRRERGSAPADSIDLSPDLGDSAEQGAGDSRGQSRGQGAE